MRPRVIAGAAAAVLLVAAAAAAQFGQGRFFGQRAVFASPNDFDGGFQFCRLVFRQASNGDGAGWNVDWPRADINLSIRLSELTRTPVSMDEREEPKPLCVNLGAPEISHCPYVMMTEPGGAYFTPDEAANLKNYLL